MASGGQGKPGQPPSGRTQPGDKQSPRLTFVFKVTLHVTNEHPLAAYSLLDSLIM